MPPLQQVAGGSVSERGHVDQAQLSLARLDPGTMSRSDRDLLEERLLDRTCTAAPVTRTSTGPNTELAVLPKEEAPAALDRLPGVPTF